MNEREASDLTVLLRWVMGHGDALGTPYPAEQATQCARRLAERARKVLPSGLRPLEVELIGSRLTPSGWLIEGVIHCPRCLRWLDFDGTPQNLTDIIRQHDSEHDAKEPE